MVAPGGHTLQPHGCRINIGIATGAIRLNPGPRAFRLRPTRRVREVKRRWESNQFAPARSGYGQTAGGTTKPHRVGHRYRRVSMNGDKIMQPSLSVTESRSMKRLRNSVCPLHTVSERTAPFFHNVHLLLLACFL